MKILGPSIESSLVFLHLQKLAEKQYVKVYDDLQPAGNWPRKSLFITIFNPVDHMGGFFITLNPGATMAEKIRSLSVNLIFFRLLMKKKVHQNIVRLNDTSWVWYEELEGQRVPEVDCRADRLVAFLTRMYGSRPAKTRAS